MNRARNLSLVPPAEPAAIHIDAQWRDDIRKRDWGRVHIEGDRREPIALSFLRKVHRL